MRWVVRGLLALVGLVVLVVMIVYGGSQWTLRRTHDVAAIDLAVPTDAASIAEGGRLARITGCRDCHGKNGEGSVLFDDPMIGRAAPPALAGVAMLYSNAELERAIRHGVRRDGTALFMMPTIAHRFLADDDTARVIAWIRSLPAGPGDSQATTYFGPLGRALVLAGMFRDSVHPETVSTKTRPAATGRYFVDISCAGCHALHEPLPSDDSKQTVPPLAPMAASYDLADFTRLLRTGQGKAPRDLGMMREAALGGLQALTDSEIAAIHAFLKGEAEKAPSQ